MLQDGSKTIANGVAEDFVLESGSPFPISPRKGQSYFLDTDITGYVKGFYVFDGVRWLSKPFPSGGVDGSAGWNDYLAPGIQINTGSPSTAPVLRPFIGNIQMFAFADNKIDQGFTSIHILHDYIPGTDLYPHIHWSHINETPSGTVRWGIEYTVARGYEVDVFTPPSSIILEPTAGAQFSHHITETTVGNAIPGANIDVDSVLLLRIFREGTHANDTFVGDAYLLYADVHYQSDGSLTVERNQPFTKYT